nr:MAG TPA: hypothetical protein [Caudoviricetes sp.]
MIDHGSPYFKPFSAFSGWEGLFYCIKICIYIDAACNAVKSLYT